MRCFLALALFTVCMFSFSGCGGQETAKKETPKETSTSPTTPTPAQPTSSETPPVTPQAEIPTPTPDEIPQPTPKIPGAGSGLPTPKLPDGIIPPGPKPSEKKPAPPKKLPRRKTFAEDARLAFRASRDRDGFQYLYAHALVDNAAGDQLQMKWVKGLNRPTLAVRWGLGVELSPVHYPIYPSLIGQLPKQSRFARNNNGNRANRGGGGGTSRSTVVGGNNARNNVPRRRKPKNVKPKKEVPNTSGHTASRELNLLVGEIGDKILAQLKTDIQKGVYGEVLKQSPMAARPAKKIVVPVEVSQQSTSKNTLVSFAKDSDDDQEEPETEEYLIQRLLPSVVMLGKGRRQELITRARRENLDVLLVFNVNISSTGRNNIERNETRFTLYDVRTRKAIYAPRKGANNIQVYLVRQEGDKKVTDPVSEMVTSLFEYAAENLQLGGLPAALTSESVMGRARYLVTQEHENPIPVLAELRFYNARNLLTDDILLKSYQKILGKNLGGQLFSGNEQAREETLQAWLPGGEEKKDVEKEVTAKK